MKHIYKIIITIILLFGLYFLTIKDDKKKNISFNGYNIEQCNITVTEENIIDTGENRLVFSKLKYKKSEIKTFLEDNLSKLKNHGVVNIVSSESKLKEGFNDIYHILFKSEVNFAGGLSNLKGEMYIFFKDGIAYIFSYTDGVDTCDSKKALGEIYNTFNLNK